MPRSTAPAPASTLDSPAKFDDLQVTTFQTPVAPIRRDRPNSRSKKSKSKSGERRGVLLIGLSLAVCILGALLIWVMFGITGQEVADGGDEGSESTVAAAPSKPVQAQRTAAPTHAENAPPIANETPETPESVGPTVKVQHGQKIRLNLPRSSEFERTRFTLLSFTPVVGGSGVQYSPNVRQSNVRSSVAFFGPKGQQIVGRVASKDLQILDQSHWMPTTETTKLPDRVFAHRDPVFDAVISRDGKLLVTGSGHAATTQPTQSRGRVCFWDTASGEILGEPIELQAPVYRVVLSPDASVVAVGSSAHAFSSRESFSQASPAVYVYNVRSRNQMGRTIDHVGETSVIRFNKSGKLLLTAAPVDVNLKLWNVAAEGPHREPLKHPTGISDAVINHDGSVVVVAGNDSHVYFWNVDTGEMISKNHAGVPESDPQNFQIAGSSNLLALSPNGERVACTQHRDRKVRFWDLHKGVQTGAPMEHDEVVTSMEFSPDGRYLLSGTGSNGRGTAQLWSAASSQPIGPPMDHATLLDGVKFNHDGQLILTHGGGDARVWLAP